MLDTHEIARCVQIADRISHIAFSKHAAFFHLLWFLKPDAVLLSMLFSQPIDQRFRVRHSEYAEFVEFACFCGLLFASSCSRVYFMERILHLLDKSTANLVFCTIYLLTHHSMSHARFAKPLWHLVDAKEQVSALRFAVYAIATD